MFLKNKVEKLGSVHAKQNNRWQAAQIWKEAALLTICKKQKQSNKKRKQNNKEKQTVKQAKPPKIYQWKPPAGA